MKIIKQELQFEKCLKQRIEFICEFSKVTPTFINGSIRKLEKTNLTYIEPHRVIIKNITFLVFNYSNDVYISNLTKKIKLSELEEYLRNNEEGLLRYQYRLGYKEEEIEKYKEELPSLGSEESHMYCVCRNRMKKNRTSWSVVGAEALLKVIMNKMNGTIEEVITKKAERKIKEELAERIPEQKVVKKKKTNKIVYAGRYEIANNFTGRAKQHVIDLLRDKKCSELMLIN